MTATLPMEAKIVSKADYIRKGIVRHPGLTSGQLAAQLTRDAHGRWKIAASEVSNYKSALAKGKWAPPVIEMVEPMVNGIARELLPIIDAAELLVSKLGATDAKALIERLA